MEELDDIEVYAGFASVYDEFMDNIPYKKWHDYIKSLLTEHGVTEGIVVELACGTGTMTKLLADDGYDMIGVDISYEMLECAREKCDADILLLQQDMRELDLYGSAAAFVCICDGMNYILTEEDLQKVFANVKTFLDYDGVFIFDMKTRYFYENVLGNRTIAENREDASFIWENEFDAQSGINEYLLTIYNVADEENDLFERSDELHRQREYDIDLVRSAMEKAGLTFVNVYDAFTREAPHEKSERLYFIAKREKK